MFCALVMLFSSAFSHFLFGTNNGQARTAIAIASEEETIIPLAPKTGFYSDSSITVEYPYYGFIEDPENPWGSVYDALDETDAIEYSDDYFSVASPGDHPELRAVSYALALAGFENQADGYPVTTVNPKLTNFLDQLGFSNFESWDIESEENGHSFGTTIGYKTLKDGETLIVVAPRNYNYMTEWLSNFNVGTSGDHNGFLESADLVVSRLNEYISDNGLSNYKIWMVGYSRGGAVVDLAAKKINENIEGYDMLTDDFYVYAFGAPKASLIKTDYTNIHDVKDGNDLLLGYLFPETWGFYNTGVYEEIHAADLEIESSTVDITKLADSSEVLSLLTDNDGVIVDVGNKNGKEFVDEWLSFVFENGLTREYFDSIVKPPLSAIMQAYQLRTLDMQSDFTDFITDISDGMLGMIAMTALDDLSNYGDTFEEAIASFPPYLDIVKILKGTATDADIAELAASLKDYMMEYSDYEDALGDDLAVTEEEFEVLKENLPKLIEALGPILVADAKYTLETYGENQSLYYLTTLILNAENLVYGHIPESIMPILKSLIPEDSDEGATRVPNTGGSFGGGNGVVVEDGTVAIVLVVVVFVAGLGKAYKFCAGGADGRRAREINVFLESLKILK